VKTSNSSLDSLPEPIDLDLDLVNRMMYWTDRGDSTARQYREPSAYGRCVPNRKEPQIVFTHLMEGIGLALDLKGGRMFLTDLGGSVYSASLDDRTRRRFSSRKETCPASRTRNFRQRAETGSDI